MTCQGRLGCITEAIEIAQDNIALCRKSLDKQSNKYTPLLASSLCNLMIYETKLGGHNNVLAIGNEATDLCSKLTVQDMVFITEIAKESICLCRAHIIDQHKLYSPLLMMLLFIQMIGYEKVGDSAQVVQTSSEILDICNANLNEQDEIYSSVLAKTLYSLMVYQDKIGDTANAVQIGGNMVDQCRKFADGHSVIFNPLLAKALCKLMIYQTKAGKRAQAVKTGNEAAVCLELAMHQPIYAMEITTEAIEESYWLIELHPDIFNHLLAIFTTALMICQDKLQDTVQAVNTGKKLVALSKHLAEHQPAFALDVANQANDFLRGQDIYIHLFAEFQLILGICQNKLGYTG